MQIPVRVRFAPSPTGDPHVGSLRTALFNWLFARHHGGTFLVRIEDTDRERYVAPSQNRIMTALAWLGLDVDEGPGVGGDRGPYVQSERLSLYREHAQHLLDAGRAYECFCAPDRLERMRAEQQARKEPTRYDRRCRDLTDAERTEQRLKTPHPVIRLRVPEQGQLVLSDLIRGDVTFALSTVDDQILMKADGFPTYHLAVVVDDHLMGITHVIRAEEWLPSAPKHLLLYQAFGWEPPAHAHIPLLLGRDRTKLSKRHGATSFQAFVEAGYLPAAMRNFLALLGWHPGSDQELLTTAELIDQFSLERVQPSGAIFDTIKLGWMNLQYLKQLQADDYAAQLVAFLANTYEQVRHRDPNWRRVLVSAVRDRVKVFADAVPMLAFVFAKPSVDAALLVPKGKTADEAQRGLLAARNQLERIDRGSWSLDTIRNSLDAAIVEVGESKLVLWPVRVAITGQRASPPVYESVALLTKEEALARLSAGLQLLSIDA